MNSLSFLPCHHSYFFVIDLCFAFFSVPVAELTQPLFAFTHRCCQYTWTCLPQGFVDSPAVFTAVVKDALCPLLSCPPRALHGFAILECQGETSILQREGQVLVV